MSLGPALILLPGVLVGEGSSEIPSTLVSAGPDYQDPLVMINARLFRALVNAGPNNAQIIGADNGRLCADIDRIISQLFS